MDIMHHTGFMRQPAETFSVASGDGKQGDDEHPVYIFDVSFLLSSYNCTYGVGCKGTLGKPHVGCCDIGAHFMGEEDEAKVIRTVAMASESDFTHGKRIKAGKHTVSSRKKADDGEIDRKTAIVDGACIFLNAPDHPNGAGCSLHQIAMREGGDHIDYKPSICSWVPLNVVSIEETDAEDVSPRVYIGRFENESWGGREHQPLDWYCLDDVANFPIQPFTAIEPLYKRMQRELLEMVDDDQAVLDQLNAYLDLRWGQEQATRPQGSSPVPSSVAVVISQRRPPIGDGSTDGKKTWHLDEE